MATNSGITLLKNNLQKGLEFLREEIRSELLAQGHRASGKLIDEIDIVIEQKTENVIRGVIKMQDYYTYVNTGTRPHWPPFDAIYEWAKIIKSGEPDKEVRSFSYAVMNVMSEEGTPSKGSFTFSNNGRRTEFSKFAIDNNRGQFNEILDLVTCFSIIIQEAVQEFIAQLGLSKTPSSFEPNSQ